QRLWRITFRLSRRSSRPRCRAAAAPTVTLFAGGADGFEASDLMLPGREPRVEDKAVQKLLPATSVTEYVSPDDYLPTLGEARAAKSTRDATPVTMEGKQGMLVRKVFDSGRYQYGGPLRGLWIDQTAEENFQIIADETLSLTWFTPPLGN